MSGKIRPCIVKWLFWPNLGGTTFGLRYLRAQSDSIIEVTSSLLQEWHAAWSQTTDQPGARLGRRLQNAHTTQHVRAPCWQWVNALNIYIYFRVQGANRLSRAYTASRPGPVAIDGPYSGCRSTARRARQWQWLVKYVITSRQLNFRKENTNLWTK